jgi:flagellar biosynthesis regulator FlaF
MELSMIEKIQSQIEAAQHEAKLLKEYADHLQKASTSNNCEYKYIVLDENMKMWVEIDSYLKNKNNMLPQEIKNNLDKLSKYVESITLSQGVDMSEKTFNSLANINNQIAEGLLDSVNVSLAQQEAYYLAKSGLDLSEAYNKKDHKLIVEALDNNQKMWIMIKTIMNKNKTNLPDSIKTNLIKLADYVSVNTLKMGQDLNNIDEKMLDSFVTINKHISEGLIGHR